MDREAYAQDRAERSRQHAELRRQRLQQLDESRQTVNGFGEEYVPIRRQNPDLNELESVKKEAQTRLRQGAARFYADPSGGDANSGDGNTSGSLSARRAARPQYSSDIGFARFDYRSAGAADAQLPSSLANAGSDAIGSPRTNASITRNRAPGAQSNRRSDAFTTSNNWLAHDTNAAPVAYRSGRRTFHQQRSVDIISNTPREIYGAPSTTSSTSSSGVSAYMSAGRRMSGAGYGGAGASSANDFSYAGLMSGVPVANASARAPPQ